MHPCFNELTKEFSTNAIRLTKDKQWILINPAYNEYVENALKALSNVDRVSAKEKIDEIIREKTTWKDEYHNQALDVFVELLGCKVLYDYGYKPEFIPKTTVQTPDIEGRKLGTHAIMECKNIRNSEFDNADKKNRKPLEVVTLLTRENDEYILNRDSSINPFLRKLQHKLEEAIGQLNTIEADTKIICLNIHFDLRFSYSLQIIEDIAEKIIKPEADLLLERGIRLHCFENYNPSKVIFSNLTI